jgi:hypothetical protein
VISLLATVATMPSTSILRRFLLAASLLAVPGCGQKLYHENTVQLGAGEVQLILIDAPKREQRVSLTVSSGGSPVDVYVVAEKDKEAAKEAVLDGKKPSASLAGKVKVQDATLEATIPANTAFAILLGGASKSSTVKVKVTGH